MSIPRTGTAAFRATIFSALLALAALLLAVSPPAAALPDEFHATYLAKARGMALGRAELQLRQEADGGYRYHSELRPRGALALIYRNQIQEFSRGAINGDGLRPQRYEYTRTGRGGREDHIAFGGAGGKSVMHYKGRSSRAQVPAEAIDPLSLHLALMRDLAAGAEQMQYLVAEPRRLKAYELAVTGRERIRTGAGEFDAIRVEVVGEKRFGAAADAAGFELERADIPDGTDGYQTTFWFAPKLNYLAVRIRHVDEDDGAVELELERLRRLSPPAR